MVGGDYWGRLELRVPLKVCATNKLQNITGKQKTENPKKKKLLLRPCNTTELQPWEAGKNISSSISISLHPVTTQNEQGQTGNELWNISR